MADSLGKGTSKANAGEVPSQLQSVANRIVPRPVDIVEEPVTINLGVAFDTLVIEFYSYARATLLAHGGELTFTSEEYSSYVRTLIASRVNYVNKRRYVVDPTDRIVVPTIVNMALAAIGRVEVEGVGVIFIPAYVTQENELLTYDQMVAISNQLEPLKYMGFQFAYGYERDRRGAFDLMSQQYVENHEKGPGVYSHNRTPSGAFSPLAFMLGLRQLHMLLGARVVYSDPESLLTAVRQLAVV